MHSALQRKDNDQTVQQAHQAESSDSLQTQGETGQAAGMPLYLRAGRLWSVNGLYSSASPLMLQREIEEGEGSYLTAEFFNLDGVRTVQANMDLRFHRTINYSTKGLRAGDTAKQRLSAIATNYEQAWDRYAVVIRAARQEARHQEQWINICVGIGAGILVGLGAAFVFPTAAAGWFSLAAGEVAGVIGSSAGQAALGAAVSSGVTDTLRPAGTELEPEGMSPAVLRMEVWQNISEMYRSALLLSEASRNLHMLSSAAEYLIGEIRVHIAGGETHMSEDSVLDMMVELVGADHDMRRFDNSLQESLEGVDRLQSAADSLNPDEYSDEDMERDIWILWISELSDPAVLDLDEIENYLHGSINVLGERSELGVDFGRKWWSWTSSEDEQNAHRAAQSHASGIRLRFRRIQGDIE